MTDSARTLLDSFETLAPADQFELALEILRRAPSRETLSEGVLLETADELLRGYDTEEGAQACATAWDDSSTKRREAER